ncbi:hypothetical protein E2I21_06145 [Alcaligenaceae bacterium SAGV5]|nr:hypothetical protein [Alcaligenaceae bacterium SAGV5]
MRFAAIEPSFHRIGQNGFDGRTVAIIGYRQDGEGPVSLAEDPHRMFQEGASVFRVGQRIMRCQVTHLVDQFVAMRQTGRNSTTARPESISAAIGSK